MSLLYQDPPLEALEAVGKTTSVHSMMEAVDAMKPQLQTMKAGAATAPATSAALIQTAVRGGTAVGLQALSRSSIGS